MKLTTLALGAVLLTPISPAAQDRVPAMAPQDKTAVEAKIALGPARIPIEAKIVTGAPYSAEVVTESMQVLADGNRIIRRTTGRVYRDAQGRMRREDDGQPGQVASISITDPVAGTSFSLDPETRIAWKTPEATARVIVAKANPDAAERRQIETAITHARELDAHATVQHNVDHATTEPIAGVRAGAADEKSEKLPARNIEGVMAEGTRITRTIPAGAIGNEQPIVSTTEQWRSPELQVLLMTRTTDPRTGESTYKLQNIVRGEQNRSFFEVPADFTVKETGIRRLAPVVK